MGVGGMVDQMFVVFTTEETEFLRGHRGFRGACRIYENDNR